jgi:predicted transcriptional regulator
VRNRSREEIIAEILWTVVSPQRKTTIMHKSMLSYGQVQSYLSILQDKELVQQESGKWVISEKGKTYLGAYKVVRELLDHEDSEFCVNDAT